MSQEASDRLDEVAKRRGKTRSEVVEALIHEAYETPESYMLKQAAFQSFAATAISLTLAKQALSSEQLEALRAEIRQAATMLYGPAPRRSWDLQSVTDADPRIDALFNAFAGE